jgi:hypothetical protein
MTSASSKNQLLNKLAKMIIKIVNVRVYLIDNGELKLNF